MIRAVLAVLVVVAILAVSQPTLQQGRIDHSATLLADEVEQLVQQGQDLVRTDEAIGGPGARRIVTIDLPASGRFAAGTNSVEIQGGRPSTIEWAVEGSTTRRRVLESLRLRTPAGEPLVLARGGEHRLLLTLRGSPGDPIVDVSRFDPAGGDSSA